MTRRIVHTLMPWLASIMVIIGLTAGVAASTDLRLPSWNSGQAGPGSGLRAGPLGLNPVAGDGTAPVAIQVPDADVDAEVERNQIVDGVMLDPSGPWVVSWYQETGLLGEVDNAVMSGHIDYWDVGPAVFWTIAEVPEGAPIHLTGENGAVYTYQVEWIKDYEIAGLTPEKINEIVGPTDYRALTLITCGGQFNGQEYLSRTVIRARLTDVDLSGVETIADADTQQGDTTTTDASRANELPSGTDADVATGELAMGGTATVTDNGLNLRGNPTTNAAVITTLSRGQRVTIIDGPQEADGFTWWQIETDDGTQGWVAGAFLTPYVP